VLWVPSTGGLTVTGISVVTALLLVAFAVFAAIAAVYGHAAVIAVLFLASFFPVGAFLMPTDHWLKWVGWVDLGLLVAAVLIWVTGRRVAVVA
jgi:ABC-type glycerol-3-phosphate transport system permease component